MADLSITAANVAAQGGSSKKDITAGATITAGQAVAFNSSGRGILASDASATLAAVRGIALHASLSGQPLKILTGGDLNIGATLSVGKVYVLSTDGAIAPADDVATGNFPSIIGIAISASILRVQLLAATAAAAADIT